MLQLLYVFVYQFHNELLRSELVLTAVKRNFVRRRDVLQGYTVDQCFSTFYTSWTSWKCVYKWRASCIDR